MFSESLDHLPLLQGINHKTEKTVCLKQQNIRKLHGFEFEIYLFNDFQAQPGLHS